MSPLDQFTIYNLGFYFTDDAKIGIVLMGALIALFLIHRSQQFHSSYTPEQPTYTPTVYEPPRVDDDWYRQQINRTEAEIAYLVKQEELRETHEWLARRNQ